MIFSNNLTIKKNKDILRYLILYTLLFALLCLCFFRIFLTGHLSFVWSGDGFFQHLKAYMYYSDWLHRLGHNFLTGARPLIPQWEFTMGYGADCITTMHYYVMGEPLTLLLGFFKQEQVPYVYNFLFLFRLYLSGLSFSCFCCHKGVRSKVGILTGSVIYTFCGYPLIMGMHHPFFVIPMIMLPVCLIGIDNVIEGKSPLLFVLSIFISAISNFYFCYMIILIAAVYGLYCCGVKSGSPKEFFTHIGRLLAGGALGLLMSFVILLPVIACFLSSSRSSVVKHYPLVHDLDFLWKMILGFCSFSDYISQTALGYPLITVFCAIFALLFLKKAKGIRFGFLACLLCLMSPYLGHVMNGFSYSSNRWIFAFSLLLGYTTAFVIEEILSYAKTLSLKKEKAVRILLALSIAVTLIQMDATIQKWFGKERPASSEYVAQDNIMPGIRGTTDRLLSHMDKRKRYSGPRQAVQRNNSILENVSSTSFYWSLTDGMFQEAMSSWGLPYAGYNYCELDGRSVLHQIAGVTHFVTIDRPDEVENVYVPEGFKFDSHYPPFTVYLSKGSHKYGYSYQNRISNYDDLSPVQKENSMLVGAVGDVPLPDLHFQGTDHKVDYQFAGLHDVKINGKRWTVEKKLGQVEIDLPPAQKDSEIYLLINIKYLCLDGIERDIPEIIEIRSRNGNYPLVKYIPLMQDHSIRYIGQDLYAINLGRGEISDVRIVFSRKGDFEVSKLEIIEQPLSDFEDSISRMKKDSLKKPVFLTNTIRGKTRFGQKKLLVIPTAFSKGWKAFIDGKETKIYRSQEVFMGIMVPAGKHKIEYRYHTPFLKEGFLISMGACILLAVWLLLRKRFSNKTGTNPT